MLEVRSLPYDTSAKQLAWERTQTPPLLTLLLKWAVRGTMHRDTLTTMSRYTGGRA